MLGGGVQRLYKLVLEVGIDAASIHAATKYAAERSQQYTLSLAL